MKAIDFIEANPELLQEDMKELKEIIQEGNESGLEFFCPNNFLGHSYSNNVTFVQHWVSVPELQAYVDLQEATLSLNPLIHIPTKETHLFKMLGPNAVRYVLDKASDLKGAYKYFSENDFGLILKDRNSLEESPLQGAKYSTQLSIVVAWQDIPEHLTQFDLTLLSELMESWRIVHEWGGNLNPLAECIKDYKHVSSLPKYASMEHRWVDDFIVSLERMKQAIYDVQLCSDEIS